MNSSRIFHRIPSDIARFLDIPLSEVVTRLGRGFWYNHIDATNDFLGARVDQTDHDSLMNWYRTTEAYIWELSAWHWADRGEGITKDHSEIFDACEGMTGQILVLGDGIGTLCLQLAERGLSPVYNDLARSRTAEFAQFRFAGMGADIPSVLTDGWEPVFRPNKYQAVVSHAFLEHVPNVFDWVKEVRDVLDDGGLFFVKNDWVMGTSADEKNSAIPMHLESNLAVAEEWFDVLPTLGFRHIGGDNLERWQLG